MKRAWWKPALCPFDGSDRCELPQMRRIPQHNSRLSQPKRARARGQALLVLIAMISVAAVLLVYGSTTEIGRSVKAEGRTRAALEYAKEALLGRAIGDTNRPGSLPCPDGDGDGRADLFTGSSCPTYIGRLPWRTLGTGDLRDESGERLWYALSPGFRDHPLAPALNSDTRGTLTVHSVSDATTVTKEAVAVVFAAGLALAGQARDDEPAQCSTNGRHVAHNLCPANYLDRAAKFSNAAAAGPYIAAPAGQFFNDRLAVIVTADFMPLVERRVALEARDALIAYRAGAACACYPWADEGADGMSTRGASRGRIPAVNASPQNWQPGVLPAYFAANDWHRVIRYAVGRGALENGGKSCTTCTDASLSIDGAGGYDLVLLTPGYASSARKGPGWRDYIDDAENRNDDDRYVTPLAGGNRIYAVTGTLAGCAANARVLVDNAPCGSPDSAVRFACRAAGAELENCGCATAARTMMKTPCTTALNSPQCEMAITQLQRCMP
jgi:hypothetical protein